MTISFPILLPCTLPSPIGTPRERVGGMGIATLRLAPLFAMILAGTIAFTIICHDGEKHFHGIEAGKDEGLAKIANRAYFTLTTMSSVGFGDVSPKSTTCRWVTSSLLIAVTVQALDSLARWLQLSQLSMFT